MLSDYCLTFFYVSFSEDKWMNEFGAYYFVYASEAGSEEISF